MRHGRAIDLSIAHKRERAARQAAEETKRFLASIVESSQDAIIASSLEGTILTWNRGAQTLFGYEPQEIIGKSAHVLIWGDLSRAEVRLG
jgi:two-component system NtrC family sensor kinase